MLEVLISSSVLILVLAILRLVLRGRISARLQYALWLLVLVRLLVPVSFFRSPVSVAEAAAPAVTRAEELSNTPVAYRYIFIGTGSPAQPEGPGRFEHTHAVPKWTARDVVRAIWFGGIAVMAAWFALVNVRLARRLKMNRMPYRCASVLPVCVAEGIPSPCLFGLFRPVIYLTPRAAEDDAEARQIITHELVHYRRGDVLWALLRSVCLAVWWFNPLVWLAAALSRQDCELACDEGTIRALGEDARFDYGRTLVGMTKVGVRLSDLLCGATTMTTGKKSLKERVERIAKAPKTSAAVAVIVLIIAAVAVGCTFSGPAAEPDTPDVLVPAIMYNGELYLSTGLQLSGDVDPQAYAGEITSVVPLSEWPTEEGQANFGKVGDPYAITTDGLVVLFNNEWTPFETIEDAQNADAASPPVQEADGVVSSSDAEGLRPGALDIATYDREYWEEVDRELAGFANSGDIEVYVSEFFDKAIPEDSASGPMTLADYVFGTDGWSFTYNSETIANDPFATILVRDADGRTLWIMDDADALMIEEADGSITWVTYAGKPVDCADMIRHLLPWARGEDTSVIREFLYCQAQNGDILSEVVERDLTINDIVEFDVSNTDITSGDPVSDDDLLQYAGLTREEYYAWLETALAELFDAVNTLPDMTGEEVAEDESGFYQRTQELYESQRERTLSRENLETCRPYLNESGQLCVIANIYSIAGADYYCYPIVP